MNPISFDFHARTRLIYGCGVSARLGELARALGVRRTLLVADPGMIAAGYAATAAGHLDTAGLGVVTFSEFGENPDSLMVEAGRQFAAPLRIDAIVGLGGGSSLDCAKGINFLLTNGGRMADYRGYGRAATPLLPMILIPTTAGTGSEAQSYAVISDAATHMKMACGDPSAAARIALLDPELTLSAPRRVTALAGYDALAHAVETWVTTKRTLLSDSFARTAWELLTGAYERLLGEPSDIEARAAMLAGAHFAGMAIEQSMLGAAHACANPLTARYGLAHGLALSILLPHVVRFNAPAVADRYAALAASADALASWLDRAAIAAGLGGSLRSHGAHEDDLPELATLAAQQWTGTFNPRPFDADAALGIYRAAW